MVIATILTPNYADPLVCFLSQTLRHLQVRRDHHYLMAVDKPVLDKPFSIANGLIVPPYVIQEQVDKLKTSFELYPDDVWISTYPKCGTTWVQQIVRLIRSNGVLEDKKLSSIVPWAEGIEGYPEVNLDEVPRPRAFKSHFPYHLMPCGPPHTTPCKYIYVMRNPKDVSVSYYSFMKLLYIKDLEFDEFWKVFTKGEVQYGDFFDHILSWWAHRDDKRVLFLKYEDLRKDLQKAISNVAEFLEVDLSPEVIAKIADLSSFKSMKVDTTSNYSWMSRYDDERGKPQFMRKGVVGDWKSVLTDEQSAEMDALCTQRLKGTGVAFDFE